MGAKRVWAFNIEDQGISCSVDCRVLGYIKTLGIEVLHLSLENCD